MLSVPLILHIESQIYSILFYSILFLDNTLLPSVFPNTTSRVSTLLNNISGEHISALLSVPLLLHPESLLYSILFYFWITHQCVAVCFPITTPSLYSILFYSILFYSILFYYIISVRCLSVESLLCPVLFYFISGEHISA